MKNEKKNEKRLDLTNSAVDQQQSMRLAAKKDRKWMEENPDKCAPSDMSQMSIVGRSNKTIYYKRTVV